MNKDLPNLLIPGYHKSGTTTLFHELSKHPDICPSIVKEPFYFRPFINKKKMPPIDEYRKNFIFAKNESFLMEGSPTYIYGGERVAKKIHETLGNVKIIICIRNPINHLYSIYKHKLRFMKENKNLSFLSFIQSNKDFSKQKYNEHIQGWYNVFDENIKCIFFDDLIKNPNKVLKDIYKWLDLEPLLINNSRLENTNLGQTYKNSLIHILALYIFKKTKNIIPHNLFIIIRKFYFKLNGTEIKSSLTEEAKSYLEPIFFPHLNGLKDILRTKGYKEFPDWLNDLETTKQIT